MFTETAAQYEARIAHLQSQSVEWRRSSGQNMVSVSVFPPTVAVDLIPTFVNLCLLDQWKESQDGERTFQWWIPCSSLQQSARGGGHDVNGQEALPTGWCWGCRGRRGSPYSRRVFFTAELRLGLVVLFLLRHTFFAQKVPRSGRHRLSGLHRNSGAWSHLPAAGWTPAGYAQWLGCTQCSGMVQ